VDGDGHARIIDFGLAKAVNSTSLLSVGPGFGRPGCVSPEQSKDFASATHRTDFYALGKSLAASYQNRTPDHAECAKLPEPWKSFCSKLTNYEAEGRHANCEEAIEDLIKKFYLLENDGKPFPIVPANFDIHATEFARWNPPPAYWTVIAAHYVLAADYAGDKQTIQSVLERLTTPVITDPLFQLNRMFPFFEEQIWEPLFGGHFSASFDSTDGLGKLLRDWIPHLNPENKVVAFRRLVRTAVSYRRFTVMGNVRSAFNAATDDALKGHFMQVLQQEDPDLIIHGGGVIPGRVP
jgi:serine/threonine protein kinase